LFAQDQNENKEKTAQVKFFVDYRFNDLGCRGRDYLIPKPPSVKRVLVLGNSYALGVGVHEEDTLSNQLEKLLNQKSNDVSEISNYEVINCSVFGFNSQQERKFYETVASKYEPDIVLLIMTAQDEPADMEYYPLKRDLFLSWQRLFHKEDRRPIPSYARSVVEVLQMDSEIRKQNGRTAVVFFRINGDLKGSTYDGRIWNDLTSTITNGLPADEISILDLGDALHKDHKDQDLLVHPRIGPHPNEIAHGIAAREISAFLRTRKLLSF
jgi:hypothetical protein